MSEQKEVYDYELAPEIAEKIIYNHDLEKKMEEERAAARNCCVEIFPFKTLSARCKKYIQFLR
jgi:hypothetical protein